MELVTSVILGLVAIALGIALILFALRARQSQGRPSNYKKGRP